MPEEKQLVEVQTPTIGGVISVSNHIGETRFILGCLVTEHNASSSKSAERTLAVRKLQEAMFWFDEATRTENNPVKEV